MHYRVGWFLVKIIFWMKVLLKSEKSDVTIGLRQEGMKKVWLVNVPNVSKRKKDTGPVHIIYKKKLVKSPYIKVFKDSWHVEWRNEKSPKVLIFLSNNFLGGLCKKLHRMNIHAVVPATFVRFFVFAKTFAKFLFFAKYSQKSHENFVKIGPFSHDFSHFRENWNMQFCYNLSALIPYWDWSLNCEDWRIGNIARQSSHAGGFLLAVAIWLAFTIGP
jgi:hypothetical protein